MNYAKLNCFYCILIRCRYTSIIIAQIQAVRTTLFLSTFSPWQHEERDTILISLCLPYFADPTRNVRCILWCLKFLCVKIRKTPPHDSTAENSTTFFQNRQILRTISSGNDIIHTPAPFPVWEFIMQIMIDVSFLQHLTMHLD